MRSHKASVGWPLINLDLSKGALSLFFLFASEFLKIARYLSVILSFKLLFFLLRCIAGHLVHFELHLGLAHSLQITLDKMFRIFCSFPVVFDHFASGDIDLLGLKAVSCDFRRNPGEFLHLKWDFSL